MPAYELASGPFEILDLSKQEDIATIVRRYDIDAYSTWPQSFQPRGRTTQ